MLDILLCKNIVYAWCLTPNYHFSFIFRKFSNWVEESLQQIFKTISQLGTLPETNVAPENRPPQ